MSAAQALRTSPLDPVFVPKPATRMPSHIPSLDGLRAVSFMIVFLAHAGFDRVIPGGFGVTVFFFLSGYLITTLMRVETGKTGHVDFKAFYLRRALRILPPFYLILLFATALLAAGALPGTLHAGPTIAQALHFSNYWIATHGWTGVTAGTAVYWSLAVEEHFYLGFPLIYVLTRKAGLGGRGQAHVFWALCAAVLAWRCYLVFVSHSDVERTYLCSDTRIDSILFGCALAVHGNPVLDAPGASAWSSRGRWLYAALPVALGMLAATFLVRNDAFRESFRYTIQGLALTPVFVCAIRWPDAPLFRVLNLRPARFIGTLSYSLYLLHLIVLEALRVGTSLSRLPLCALGLAISIALSWGMWVVVEEPCAKLRRRLSSAG